MKPIELLLISPPDYQTREFRNAQPLGIAYLAAALREAAGIPCELLDANAREAMPLDGLADQVLRFVAETKARGGRPIVGISVVSQVVATSVELARRIKAVHPDVLIILGGYHPTFAHYEILQDFPSVDLCVRGEGEQTIVEIMQHWQGSAPASASGLQLDWSHILGVSWRRGDEVIVNPSRPNISDLDVIPFPARDLLLPLNAYPGYADTVAGKMRVKASIMSSRGCPFHCNFCSIIAFYGDAGGKPWRGRSVQNVVAEMASLADAYGASHFEFQDDNFFVRPERALSIVDAYTATGRDFSFAFLTRADQIVRGERFFPALRQAGLRYVSVGIESGSDASLERMVKQTSVEVNRRALQILHDNDVAAQVEFIMFEPGTTLADLQANLRFIEEQGLFGYFPPLIFGSLLLLPGTPVREQMEREAGLSGSIHEALTYRFADLSVAAVQALLNEFQRRMGNTWYALAFDLLDSIPAEEISMRAGNGAFATAGVGQRQPALALSARALAQLKLEFFALTRIPYNLLRSALAVSATGSPLPSETLLARAADELASVTRRVQGLRQPELQDRSR